MHYRNDKARGVICTPQPLVVAEIQETSGLEIILLPARIPSVNNYIGQGNMSINSNLDNSIVLVS